MKKNKKFYSDPDTFSFKDLLAVLFTIGFFYACFRALTEAQALNLVQSIAYLMAIILGGYFSQEIASTAIDKFRQNNNSGNIDNGYVQPIDLGGDGNAGVEQQPYI